MKKSVKKIAFFLCIIFTLTTMQFTASTAAYANKAPWVDTLVNLLKNSSNQRPTELFNFFEKENMRAADWIVQDAQRLGMTAQDIFSGNIQNIYKLAKSVDNSASENDSLEELLRKYGNAVETRFDNHLRSVINKLSDQFVVVKHKQLGRSNFSYTAGLSDDKGSPEGNQLNFFPDSELVLLTLTDKGDRVEIKEEVLLTSERGVIRDPDVSPDGMKLLFSWKKDFRDDFHLYEMNLQTREIKQLTFGPGVADIEPRYLNNGKILFSSTRPAQRVDCWITPVINLYMCDEDGKNIVRIGFDQVHTVYPTVTSDGRVIYTRWDYNDRTQMFTQSLFQMQADGTNQTELFGNNSNFPTNLVHTREIPGYPGRYFSIALGHHTLQAGKLVTIDITKGRNNPDSVDFVFPDRYSTKQRDVDVFGQVGPIYKYPYPVSATEVLVSFAPNGYASDARNTPFGIYYMNTDGTRDLLCESKNGRIGASQIVPVMKLTLFERPDLVDYSTDTGTFYIGDIYEGDGLKGIPRGEAKYLRVVALEYRTASIGANQAKGTGTSDPHTPIAIGNGSWDIKKVLGIVPIEEDGSVLFRAPARVPLYFQVLNENGEMIQSMRSWGTLMPGENFSCVGCHEDKNTVPPLYGSAVTMAMMKGVSDIMPDFWQTGEGYENYDPYKDYKGFSYMDEIQPILDKSCVSCHNNKELTIIGDQVLEVDMTNAKPILPIGSVWKYSTSGIQPVDWNKASFNDSSWLSGTAPFGKSGTPPGGVKTEWTSSKIYLRKEFNITQQQLNSNTFIINIAYDENPIVYINGIEIFRGSGHITKYEAHNVTSKIKDALKPGKNIIAVYADNDGGGQLIDVGLYTSSKITNVNKNPISLESDPVYASREKRNWPLSYLVLTQAQWNGKGRQLIANSANKYTNWISSMSRVEMLKTYEVGSSKSYLIEKLRDGHGNLTDIEIRKISAWIDLSVPMAGRYDERHAWSANDMREYEERNHIRAYFEMADKMAIRSLKNGGVYPDSRELTIIYYKKDKEIARKAGTGLVQLISPQSYAVGDKIRIELPEGEKYLFFNLDTRIKEALIYVPDGVFEYEIPSSIIKTMPKTVRPGTDVTFINPMISARIPSKEDLEEVRNIALNPYDSKNNNKAFPHVVASNSNDSSLAVEFEPRNAIDGFLNNLGHGVYPVQSWGGLEGNIDNAWYQINFGREVEINSVAITIRADFPHDTHFTSVTIEFSDGKTKTVSLRETAEPQVIELGSIKTSSIKLKNFKKASNTWAAITEIEVYGKNA